jgi:GTP cyclohydrolase I
MAWIGVIPGERVIGLSKFNRLTEWVMARPHIQEEAAVMLADEIEGLIKPKGLAVVIRAAHQCISWRGVRESATSMNTSVMRGLLMDNDKARNEFLMTIKGQGF